MRMPVENDTLLSGLPADGEAALIVGREEGVWMRADGAPQRLRAAIGSLFLSGSFLAGLDYAVFLRMVYGGCSVEPGLPAAMPGTALVRVADAIVPFQPGRRGLYKSVKIVTGAADYFFEPVFLETGAGEPQAATLDFDEFVADLWVKGVRFGIDAAAVREAIAAARPGAAWWRAASTRCGDGMPRSSKCRKTCTAPTHRASWVTVVSTCTLSRTAFRR